MAQPKADPESGALTAARAPDLAAAPAAATLLVAAVVVHDRVAGRVLLLQRGPHASHAPGLWDFPGGKAEPGEPITETATRELREETGLLAEPQSLLPAHLVHGARGTQAPNGYLCVVFVAGRWTGEPYNVEPDKHAAVRWVDTDAIPAAVVPSTGHALTQYLTGGPQISLRGWS